MNRTGEEHLTWCKERAEEYLKRGEVVEAWAVFVSDMKDHEETSNHPAIGLGLGLMMMIGNLNTVREMREFINGCR